MYYLWYNKSTTTMGDRKKKKKQATLADLNSNFRSFSISKTAAGNFLIQYLRQQRVQLLNVLVDLVK
jgi:hypothetical protein